MYEIVDCHANSDILSPLICTFIANGLDGRHCTIGRLNLIHSKFLISILINCACEGKRRVNAFSFQLKLGQKLGCEDITVVKRLLNDPP